MLKNLPVREMTLADCVYVCTNMREDDFNETSSLTYAKTREAMAVTIMNQGGESYTVLNRKGRPVMIGGAYYTHPNLGTMWIFATDEVTNRDWWVATHFITNLIQIMFDNEAVHRVQAYSIGWRKVSHKWLQKGLGMVKEGHLRGFAANGYDVLIFGKIKETQNG